MKFTTIALSLGCAAVVCVLDVQSDLFSVKAAHDRPLVEFRYLLDHSWLAFLNIAPGWLRTPAGAEDDQAQATVPPPLSKAETLMLIGGAAAKYRVPAEFVASIVAAESNFDSTAISCKGAIGLMQLMPETAKQFGANPSVPAENVDAGTHYLRYLMVRYQNSREATKRVIAAYNAGPGMVDRYRGVPPFRETRTYVARVLGFLKQFSPAGKRGSRHA
jgi:soluble lytic murein transglycosylase-like protein